MRVHVEVGDILVMPANYLHFVLTKGDAVSLGTNFLAMGHLPMIKESMILEYAKNANDKFPGLPEMLVLMMHQLVGDLHPRLCRRLVSTYNTVRQIYNHTEVLQVRFFFLNIMLVWKKFCDLGSNCGLSLGLKIKGTCFSNFGSNHGLAHFTILRFRFQLWVKSRIKNKGNVFQ